MIRIPTRRMQRGVALPIVLMLSAMMLTTSVAWFEMSIAAARAASNTQDALQAFHAADAALTRCAQMALNGTASALPDVALEPVGWQHAATFDAAALTPVMQWPGTPRPPQCLVEGWLLPARPETRAWLITARGFGATRASQIWLQMELVVDGERVERHWRQIVARPF
ncbi:pilus assembly PilX family protein [Paraburkholderia sp.]|uniref:pilus assembly PilX family protein n=1 Tax=Paraburkholderia sp. TaxID=1926495 RepID=UPI003D6E1380